MVHGKCLYRLVLNFVKLVIFTTMINVIKYIKNWGSPLVLFLRLTSLQILKEETATFFYILVS